MESQQGMALRLRPVCLALIAISFAVFAALVPSAFAQTCTVRSQSELLTMFSPCSAQGKPPGCITSQDMQDLICSMPTLGGGITQLLGPVTATGPGASASSIAPTGVTPGSYTCPSITVNAAGQVISIANGSCGGGGGAVLGLYGGGSLGLYGGGSLGLY